MSVIVTEHDKGKFHLEILNSSYKDIEYKFDSWNWKNLLEKRALRKAWYDRNVIHGDVFIKTLEVKNIKFHQTIFVQDTTLGRIRLSRLGFEILTGFPDEGKFKDFSEVMYHKEDNIAITLYDPDAEYFINKAIEIANLTSLDYQTNLAIFVNTMKVLFNGTKTN